MRHFLDTTCPRCGASTSTEGASLEYVRIIAAAHVCADGVRTPAGEPVARDVPGPGERTKLPEERG